VHLVTPIPAANARPLVKGLANEVVVRGDDARRLFPEIEPLDYAAALRLALRRTDAGDVETAWSDALVSSQGAREPKALVSTEGMIVERRRRPVPVPAACVFRVFARIGGHRGWPAMDWAWQWRGAVDRLLGGVGMRRGRRDPENLRPGDALDFWRVEAVEAGRLVRLRAEMRVPGRAWLEFEARPEGEGACQLVQTAVFEPRGLAGLLYWYALYPVHALVFRGTIRRLAEGARAKAAEDFASTSGRPSV
jgi:hypothetical protein